MTSPGTTGAVRLGRDTARLLGRLQPGDIAVLDHVDLDATTAEALVACGVGAVVNASPGTSGRYPNLGPRVLVDAGIPVLDGVGPDVFGALHDGRTARLDGDTLWVGDERVATGTPQDPLTVAASAEQARAGLAAQLADLTANATGFLLDERDLLLEGVGIPRLTTDLTGRYVLVVAPGYGAVEDLALLRSFRREHRPVVIGVDGGAELLLAHGIVADIVVGDPTAMSDEVLTKAQEVVGRAGCWPRGELGVTVIPFGTTAAAEDLALLMADQGGAAVVVAVGFPTTLEQLLDRGRSAAPSSLLVRAGLGDRVVGARAAAALSRQRLPLFVLLLLVFAAWGALAVALAFAGAGGFDPAVLEGRWSDLLERLPW